MKSSVAWFDLEKETSAKGDEQVAQDGLDT